MAVDPKKRIQLAQKSIALKEIDKRRLNEQLKTYNEFEDL